MFLPALSLRATRVYLLLCCSCYSCSWGVINQNTAVFTNFVQFHHASPTVGCQHIASFITGHRPADLQSFKKGRQQFVSFWPAAAEFDTDLLTRVRTEAIISLVKVGVL
jgi:hypothetical protein